MSKDQPDQSLFMNGFLKKTILLFFTILAGQVLGHTDLVLTEIMYNPKGSDDYEFVEFYNAGTESLNLSGYSLVKDANDDGLAFSFPSVTLAAGAFMTVVEKSSYFQQRYQSASSPYYQDNLIVAGAWSGGLGNKGEIIILKDALGQEIFSFKYDDKGDWPVEASGLGSSLELKNPTKYKTLTSVEERNKYLGDGDNWRASADYHGNPGRDGGKASQSVVINEILANTDGEITDTIEIYNPTSDTIDIGGWYLSDSTTFEKYRIPDETLLAPEAYATFDETQFNPNGEWNPNRGAQGATEFSFSGSKGDQVYLIQVDETGNLIRMVDHVEFGPTKSGESFGLWPDGDGVFTPMTSFTSGSVNSGPRIGPLVITEIMYNPGDQANANELEFIEIHNSGSNNEDLSDWTLETAIGFSFPQGAILTTGSYLLVCGFNPADPAKLSGFQSKYGIDDSITILGPWTGSLSNNSEKIQLKRRDLTGDLQTNITTGSSFYPLIIEDEVIYSDDGDWPTRADGIGSSLSKKTNGTWGMDAENWRSSNEFAGNPGTAGKPEGEIAITEVLSHTDYPQQDTIELFNPGGSNVEIGGWYLSDTSENATDSENFRKYQIPAGTIIPAGGYLTFGESHFNPNVNQQTGLGTPAANHFALSSAYNDDVALVEANDDGTLVRIVDHVEFGPSENGVSFGIWPDTEGRFYPMKEQTLGETNTGPLINPVVISEIHYNPGDMANASELEFVELYNTGSSQLNLANWKLSKAVEFNFNAAHNIAAESALVIVGFDVTDSTKISAFRTRYGINESVTVIGPWTGTLSNAGEALELQKNDILEVPIDGAIPFYPMVFVERVRYDDKAPWPVSPDGLGNSLERVDPYVWSDTENNWGASIGNPTPGSLNIPNFAPVFTSEAVINATEDENYTYTITALDSNPDDALVITSTIVDSWLSLIVTGVNTWTLSGTPSNENVGAHLITLSLTDGSEIVQQTFTIQVVNTNDAPIFTSTPVTTAMSGRNYSYSILTDDPDTTDLLTISGTNLPQWINLTENGDGTATLEGTPSDGDIGTHSISISLSDGELSIEQNFTINVAAENLPPSAISMNNNNVSENTIAPYSVGMLSVSDPETEDTHVFSMVEGIGSDDNESFSISGKSLLTNIAFDFETQSSHVIRIRVTDSTGNIFEQSFTIQITDDNTEDRDEDGLTEQIEEAIGTSDLTTDSDMDGISDANEYGIGSNPAKSESIPSTLSLSATHLSDNWKYLGWFGVFRDNYNGWIYHLRLGWVYVRGTETDNIWMWDSKWAWMWTSSNIYPWLFSKKTNNWIYYFQGPDQLGSSDPRWFLDSVTSEWQQGTEN